MTGNHKRSVPGLAAAFLLLAACGGPAPEAPAPESRPEDAAATITASDIAVHIGALAHDSMRGRDTPSPELEEAAAYLAAQFEAMGLEPAGDDGSYLHRWEYRQSRLDRETVMLRVKGVERPAPEYAVDYFMVIGTQPSVEGPAVYAGRAGQSQPLPEGARGGVAFFDAVGTELDQTFQQQLVAAVQASMMTGATAIVIILDPGFDAQMMGQIAQGVAGQQAPLPIVGITHEAGNELLRNAGADPAALRAAGEPAVLNRSVIVGGTRVEQTHRPANVAALLRGSDPALRGTYVVVTAHFDHVGVGTPDATGDSIYNGADDNASGTAAVLEMAEAFAALPTPPRRSILFLPVSGEEKGLLGAMAWVEDPTVPIDNVVANINLDMVGRAAPDTVIGIGQEYTNLQDVLTAIVADHPNLGLAVIRDPEPEKMFFFRSDQLAFIRQMIPAVFFTVSEHEDYHKPSDEPARIDNDKAARIARLAFYLAHRIAMDPMAPQWTEEGREQVERMIAGAPF